jgi:DinB superfamily
MNEQTLRRELIRLLEGKGAHMTFEEAVADFPDEAINERAPHVTYTPFGLVEHIRLVQADLLEYVTSSDYRDKEWPDDFWPAEDQRATREELDASIESFLGDRRALRELVEDPATDLFAVISGSPGHTLLREVRMAGDHCAYHVGEFAILRQVMGTWPG